MPGKPKIDEAAVYVARSSGLIRIKGTVYRYLRNQTHIPAGHPLLDVIPSRFAPLRIEGAKAPPEVSVVQPSVIPEVVVNAGKVSYLEPAADTIPEPERAED